MLSSKHNLYTKISIKCCKARIPPIAEDYALLHRLSGRKKCVNNHAAYVKQMTANMLFDYFYRCTVHFEDSLSIIHQQMH
jgi:hypothetical protein